MVFSQEKVLFWEDTATLIIADVHLGAKGMPVEDDLLRLSDIIFIFAPQRVLILGDLFDKQNNDFIAFAQWRKQFSQVQIELIAGKHDTLSRTVYHSLGIEVFESEKEEAGLLYSHTPMSSIDTEVVVCGHIHPSVQGLPCFYIGNRHIILPSFNEHVHTTPLTTKAGDILYLVSSNGLEQL